MENPIRKRKRKWDGLTYRSDSDESDSEVNLPSSLLGRSQITHYIPSTPIIFHTEHRKKTKRKRKKRPHNKKTFGHLDFGQNSYGVSGSSVKIKFIRKFDSQHWSCDSDASHQTMGSLASASKGVPKKDLYSYYGLSLSSDESSDDETTDSRPDARISTTNAKQTRQISNLHTNNLDLKTIISSTSQSKISEKSLLDRVQSYQFCASEFDKLTRFPNHIKLRIGKPSSQIGPVKHHKEAHKTVKDTPKRKLSLSKSLTIKNNLIKTPQEWKLMGQKSKPLTNVIKDICSRNKLSNSKLGPKHHKDDHRPSIKSSSSSGFKSLSASEPVRDSAPTLAKKILEKKFDDRSREIPLSQVVENTCSKDHLSHSKHEFRHQDDLRPSSSIKSSGIRFVSTSKPVRDSVPTPAKDKTGKKFDPNSREILLELMQKKCLSGLVIHSIAGLSYVDDLQMYIAHVHWRKDSTGDPEPLAYEIVRQFFPRALIEFFQSRIKFSFRLSTNGIQAHEEGPQGI